MQCHGSSSADGNINPHMDGDNAAAAVLDSGPLRGAWLVVARPAEMGGPLRNARTCPVREVVAMPHQLRQGLIAALAASLLCCSAGLALAQTGVPPLWTTNGRVYAMVDDGGTIYIGGDFTKVGRTTGSWAGIDASTGTPQGPYAGVMGKVLAVAPDGNGGWYLGGSFTAVRGQPRNNLAHLDATGNLTAWDPDVRGPGAPVVGVYALAVNGGTVYVGGSFFSVLTFNMTRPSIFNTSPGNSFPRRGSSSRCGSTSGLPRSRARRP